MIATAIVLIEATDPKVYYYNIMFVSMMYLMSNFVSDICCIVHLGSQIKFLLSSSSSFNNSWLELM